MLECDVDVAEVERVVRMEFDELRPTGPTAEAEVLVEERLCRRSSTFAVTALTARTIHHGSRDGLMVRGEPGGERPSGVR